MARRANEMNTTATAAEPQMVIDEQDRIVDANTGEVLQEAPSRTALAITGQDEFGGFFAGATASIEVVQQVTYQVIGSNSWPTGRALIMSPEAPWYEGEELAVTPKGRTKMAPALLMKVRSPTGNVAVVIVAEVMRSELERAYPNNGYVGKWFSITRFAPREGKNYNTYAIVEIRDPTRRG